MSFSPTDLGETIKTARENRGLSQKALADLAGIGKTAMFDLEHGNPGVRLNTLLAVLHELDMHLELKTSSPPPSESSATTSSAPVAEDLPEHLL
ncbi:helix-turn-helix domain-containing protein [Kiritimatiellaeota bacterium B1221]|nr:helix-turn-helix domain-containing protein [Kiritimatiellaeota bacterium B1221]